MNNTLRAACNEARSSAGWLPAAAQMRSPAGSPAIVAHAHAVGMALVHHHLAACAQRLGKRNVARQRARDQQRHRPVHGVRRSSRWAARPTSGRMSRARCSLAPGAGRRAARADQTRLKSRPAKATRRAGWVKPRKTLPRCRTHRDAPAVGCRSACRKAPWRERAGIFRCRAPARDQHLGLMHRPRVGLATPAPCGPARQVWRHDLDRVRCGCRPSFTTRSRWHGLVHHARTRCVSPALMKALRPAGVPPSLVIPAFCSFCQTFARAGFH